MEPGLMLPAILLVLVIVVPIVGSVFLYVTGAAGEKQRLAAMRARLLAAESDYNLALAALRNSPGDPDLRSSVLQRGRIYGALTREQKAATLYDEVAIMNDIGAATAGIGGGVERVADADQISSFQMEAPKERLTRLTELFESNLISAEEFAEQRMRILSTI